MRLNLRIMLKFEDVSRSNQIFHLEKHHQTYPGSCYNKYQWLEMTSRMCPKCVGNRATNSSLQIKRTNMHLNNITSAKFVSMLMEIDFLHKINTIVTMYVRRFSFSNDEKKNNQKQLFLEGHGTCLINKLNFRDDIEKCSCNILNICM